MGGRVAPTNSGSAISPALRSPMGRSYPEHAADPCDDLWRTEGNRNTEDCPDAPAPGQAIRHRHGPERHHENDGDWRQPGEYVRLKRRGACHEGRALRLCDCQRSRRQHGDRTQRSRWHAVHTMRTHLRSPSYSRLGDNVHGSSRTCALLFPPPIEFLPLDPARGAETKAGDNERMVVLLFTLLIGPVIGADARFDEQLITLACVARQCLAHHAKGHEPKTCGDLTSSAAFILSGVVVPDEAEARVAPIAFGNELRIASKITYRSERETIHLTYSSGQCWWWCDSGAVYAAHS